MQCSCEWRLQAGLEMGQQAKSGSAAAPEPGPEDPFGLPAAMAPAFAGVAAAQAVKPAGSPQTLHGGSPSSALALDSVPALGAPATSGADGINPMPFGSPAGKGIAATCKHALHHSWFQVIASPLPEIQPKTSLPFSSGHSHEVKHARSFTSLLKENSAGCRSFNLSVWH